MFSKQDTENLINKTVFIPLNDKTLNNINKELQFYCQNFNWLVDQSP